MAHDGEERLANDLEGGGSGGGTEVVHEEEAEPRPGSRLTLVLTLLLVALILAVPVLWAAGVYANLVILPGVGPAATAGYLLLLVILAAAALLYLWGPLRRAS